MEFKATYKTAIIGGVASSIGLSVLPTAGRIYPDPGLMHNTIQVVSLFTLVIIPMFMSVQGSRVLKAGLYRSITRESLSEMPSAWGRMLIWALSMSVCQMVIRKLIGF